MADTTDKGQGDFADGEREKRGLGKDTIKRIASGYSDPSGEYPTPDYLWRPSLNKVATGEATHTLSMGGADPALIDQNRLEQITNANVQKEIAAAGEVSLDAFGGPGADVTPEYGKAQIQQTKSGHIIMLDDTAGSEKILIKHNKGTGIEFAKDGSVMIRSKNNFSVSVDANGVMIFEGDLAISCKGLKADITGDLDLNVTGDYNLKVGGDKKETILGADRSTIDGNRGETVKGNKSSTVIKSRTNTTLGNLSEIVKDALRSTVGGTRSISVTGQSKHTSETEIAMSTNNMNLAAADMTVIGATGTIGGDGIIMYNHNLWTGHTVTAGVSVDAPMANLTRLNGTSAHMTTFHGSLTGTADVAILSGHTHSQSYAANIQGTNPNYTNTNTTAALIASDSDKSVALPGPTAAIMKEYLTQSNRGIQKVSVDDGNFIKDKIVRSKKMGGMATKKLTTAQARALLKDPLNVSNSALMTALIADGSINSNILKPVPPSTGRTYSPGKTAVAPQQHMRSGISNRSSKIIGGKRAAFTVSTAVATDGLNGRMFIPDPRFNPQAIDPRKGPYAITSKTLLAQGIPISTFLGGNGRTTTLGHLSSFEARQTVARNLMMQTLVIELCKYDVGPFEDYRLICCEGLLSTKNRPKGTKSGDINDLAQMGQVITYELYNDRGRIVPSATFEFAQMLAEELSVFDEIRLYFDDLDPWKTGIYRINSQIMVIMPWVPSDFNIAATDQKPKFKTQTFFNGRCQSDQDLIEINDGLSARSRRENH